MNKMGVNSIIGMIFIAFSIFWNILIKKLPTGTKLAVYGPKFFPQIVIGGIIIVSILLIIQDIANKDNKIKFEFEKTDVLKVIVLVIVIIGYLLLMPITGYIISTIVALGITLWLFGLRNPRNFILASILFPVLSNILFQTVLKVGLP